MRFFPLVLHPWSFFCTKKKLRVERIFRGKKFCALSNLLNYLNVIRSNNNKKKRTKAHNLLKFSALKSNFVALIRRQHDSIFRLNSQKFKWKCKRMFVKIVKIHLKFEKRLQINEPQFCSQTQIFFCLWTMTSIVIKY